MNSLESSRPAAHVVGNRGETQGRSEAQPSVRSEGPATASQEVRGQKVRKMLRAQLGDDVYTSWFQSMEFEHFDGKTVRVSVPVKFLKNWMEFLEENADLRYPDLASLNK